MQDWGWAQSPKDNSYRYRIPIRPGGSICEHLGIVKPRDDGRWDWWRKPSQFQRWDPGQGVAATKQEAVDYVEEGWGFPVVVNYDPAKGCTICGRHVLASDMTLTIRLNTLGTHMMPKPLGRTSVEVHEACVVDCGFEKYAS